jgi:Tfp pilus assembly protein PilX
MHAPCAEILNRNSKTKHRHGSILVVVLISLLVATVLGASLIRTVLTRHRQMHVLASQQQALWLAEAGVQRAFRELAKTPDYDGETWEVPPDALGEGSDAKVTIDVSKTEDAPEGRLVRVRAELDTPAAAPTGFQREVTLRLPRQVSSEAKKP